MKFFLKSLNFIPNIYKLQQQLLVATFQPVFFIRHEWYNAHSVFALNQEKKHSGLKIDRMNIVELKSCMAKSLLSNWKESRQCFRP